MGSKDKLSPDLKNKQGNPYNDINLYPGKNFWETVPWYRKGGANSRENLVMSLSGRQSWKCKENKKGLRRATIMRTHVKLKQLGDD